MLTQSGFIKRRTLQYKFLTCAEFHDNDLSPAFLLFFDGQKLDNIFVFDFLQHLEFSHLNLLRPHVRQLVERLHGYGLPVMFVHALQ